MSEPNVLPAEGQEHAPDEPQDSTNESEENRQTDGREHLPPLRGDGDLESEFESDSGVDDDDDHQSEPPSRNSSPGTTPSNSRPLSPELQQNLSDALPQPEQPSTTHQETILTGSNDRGDEGGYEEMGIELDLAFHLPTVDRENMRNIYELDGLTGKEEAHGGVVGKQRRWRTNDIVEEYVDTVPVGFLNQVNNSIKLIRDWAYRRIQSQGQAFLEELHIATKLTPEMARRRNSLYTLITGMRNRKYRSPFIQQAVREANKAGAAKRANYIVIGHPGQRVESDARLPDLTGVAYDYGRGEASCVLMDDDMIKKYLDDLFNSLALMCQCRVLCDLYGQVADKKEAVAKLVEQYEKFGFFVDRLLAAFSETMGLKKVGTFVLPWPNEGKEDEGKSGNEVTQNESSGRSGTGIMLPSQKSRQQLTVGALDQLNAQQVTQDQQGSRHPVTRFNDLLVDTVTQEIRNGDQNGESRIVISRDGDKMTVSILPLDGPEGGRPGQAGAIARPGRRPYEARHETGGAVASAEEPTPLDSRPAFPPLPNSQFSKEDWKSLLQYLSKTSEEISDITGLGKIEAGETAPPPPEAPSQPIAPASQESAQPTPQPSSNPYAYSERPDQPQASGISAPRPTQDSKGAQNQASGGENADADTVFTQGQGQGAPTVLSDR